MAVAVVLKCSECATVREASLNPGDPEITCPACARRMKNLTDEEFGEIQEVQKKQRMLCIVAVALFAAAVVCLVVGMSGRWAFNKQDIEAGAAQFNRAPLLIGAIACGLAAIVVGVMGSRKRFVVEF
ncbi:MAG: hypothetical protein ABSE73_29325 [Planctomycetota bacterium]